MKKEKVFCIECDWYTGNCLDGCVYPKNYKDTYRKKAEHIDKNPDEINKNNNCKWFKKRINIFYWLRWWFSEDNRNDCTAGY